jgi:xylitol oxidase
MNRKTFLQSASVITGGIILSDISACNSAQKTPAMNEHLTNWAGNLTYSTGNVHYPKTVESMQEVVRKCDKLRALGSRHSFNTIADSKENQLSLQNINKVIALDKNANTITIESGTRYGDFAPYLDENGYALANLASLPHITVAGACATATHGSGVNNGNLSTSVAAIEFINAAGDVVRLSKKKDGDKFYGAVVHLGAIGIVTKVTLDIVPTFKMKQLVYLNMPMDELKNNFNDLESKGYSVSLFTDWKDKNINEVWIKSRVDDGNTATAAPELYGAKLATKNMHPIATESAENVTDQMGIPGPWYERMPHFKMGFKPSAGKELQAEFFVPIEHAYNAIMAVEKLNEKITPHLFITEIRTIHADEFWMSPCYKQTSVAIHFTWKQQTEAVMNLLPLIEEQLSPFNAKPHWAKLFTMQPKVLQSRYEKLTDFKQLVAEYDPKGKFRNEFLEKNIYS